MRRNGNVTADLAGNCRFESCCGDAGSNPVVAKPFLSPQSNDEKGLSGLKQTQICITNPNIISKVVFCRKILQHVLIWRSTVSDWASVSTVRACGLMDKAPDFGSGDCRFESCHARFLFSTNIHLIPNLS